MIVFKREGADPNTAWNEILRRVNELATECDLELLEEVDENHIWTTTDVQDVKDKLIEICDDNSFSEHHLWHQTTIDEIVAAIENGSCCDDCEDEDDDVGRLGGILSSFPISGQTFWSICDWASELHGEGVNEGFTSWELYAQPGMVLVASGPVVDDVIQVEEDPAQFPYVVEGTPLGGGEGSTNVIKTALGETVASGIIVRTTTPPASPPPAGSVGGYDSAPWTFVSGGTEPSGSFVLRLKC